MKEFKFKPGDTVWVSGPVYQSANGTLIGKTLDKQKACIKKVAEKAAHPYAIEGMWGWFNEKSLKPYIAPPELEIGTKVTLIKNETYNHTQIKLSPHITYEVIAVDEDKVKICFNGTIKYTVSIYNLKKI